MCIGMLQFYHASTVYHVILIFHYQKETIDNERISKITPLILYNVLVVLYVDFAIAKLLYVSRSIRTGV